MFKWLGSNQCPKDALDVLLNSNCSEHEIAAASDDIFRSFYSKKKSATGNRAKISLVLDNDGLGSYLARKTPPTIDAA